MYELLKGKSRAPLLKAKLEVLKNRSKSTLGVYKLELERSVFLKI
jgi:hypothetical protein